MRAATGLLITTLAAASLAGCAHDPQPLAFDQIKPIVADLGGDPNRFFQVNVTQSPLGESRYAEQVVYLVPSENGSFRVIDANGVVYQDYQDFLRNNTMGG